MMKRFVEQLLALPGSAKNIFKVELFRSVTTTRIIKLNFFCLLFSFMQYHTTLLQACPFIYMTTPLLVFKPIPVFQAKAMIKTIKVTPLLYRPGPC